MRTEDVRGTLVRIQRGTRINRDHEMEENREILDRLVTASSCLGVEDPAMQKLRTIFLFLSSDDVELLGAVMIELLESISS
jgi:hypothetical protein